MAGAYPACTPNGGISGDGQRRSLCQKEGCAAPYRRCHLNSCLCLHTSGAQNSSRIFLCPFEVVPEKAVLRCREGDVRNQYVSFLPAMPPFHISIYPGSQMRVQGLISKFTQWAFSLPVLVGLGLIAKFSSSMGGRSPRTCFSWTSMRQMRSITLRRGRRRRGSNRSCFSRASFCSYFA